MDFDIIGILFILWIIFSGISSSQKSKKAKQKKQEAARNKNTRTASKPQQKRKPQESKSLNPFEKLMEAMREMEQSTQQPGGPQKSRPVQKRTSPREEQIDTQMQDIGDMKTELEKKVAIEKKEFEDKFSQKVDEQKDKIGKEINKHKDQIRDVIKQGEQEWKSQSAGLEITREKVINGIIWSEILQAPRAQNKFKNKLMK